MQLKLSVHRHKDNCFTGICKTIKIGIDHKVICPSLVQTITAVLSGPILRKVGKLPPSKSIVTIVLLYLKES